MRTFEDRVFTTANWGGPHLRRKLEGLQILHMDHERVVSFERDVLKVSDDELKEAALEWVKGES